MLHWLQGRLEDTAGVSRESSPDLKEWLDELSDLRSKTGTGKPGTPLGELIDDLREERN